VLDDYLAALRRGETPDKLALLARHPELASDLRECLGCLDLIQQAAVPPPVSALEEQGTTANDPVRGVLGDFRILRDVGRGGMGVVYEAEQISLGRRVALKVLPFASTLDPRQLQRFKNEAQAAANLHHTNIVPVYATGCERGVHYYAMQFIEGRSLAELLLELRRHAGLGGGQKGPVANDLSRVALELLGGHAPLRTAVAPDSVPTAPYQTPVPLPTAPETPAPHAATSVSIHDLAFFRKAAQLAVQAADALEHSHQLGIVHRDIKPANLLVEQSPLSLGDKGRGGGMRLWITDFGLAHCRSQVGLTLTGEVVGTLRYMSPEQALAKRASVDHRTDVYSLGVTLYELLTLEPAFGGRDREELLRQIAFEEPRPPRRLNKGVPAELETIVLKAIEKNPAERYATAQEMADDLRRFLDDRPIHAKRPTLVQRARKWTRRHKAAARAVACVIAVLLVTTGAFWYERHRRLETVEQKGRDALNEAHAFFHANQLTPARMKLAEAEGLIGSDRFRLGDLAEQIEAFAAEMAKFEDFFRLVDQGHEAEIPAPIALAVQIQSYQGVASALPVTRDPERDPGKAVPHLLEALSRYGVLESEEWKAALDNGSLGKDEVEQVQRTAYEELLWLADDLLDRREDHRSSQKLSPEAAARQTLAYLAKAESAYSRTTAFYRIRARCRETLGEKAEAANDEQLARRTRPTLALDHYLLGLAAYGAGNKAEGIRQFEAALHLEPTHYWSLMRLGYCFCDLGREEQDFAAAAGVFTGCIMRRPTHAHAYFCRGNANSKWRRFQQARDDYSKALELDPENVLACVNRANMSAQLAEPEESIQQYRQALAVVEPLARAHPNVQRYRANQALCHGELGSLSRATGHPKEAEEHLKKAVALWEQLAGENPAAIYRNDLAGSLDHLSLLYRATGQFEKAESGHKRALDLWEQLLREHPKNISYLHDSSITHSNLAILYGATNRPKDAETSYLKALAVQEKLALEHPQIIPYQLSLAVVHYNLGNLYGRGRPKEAEAALQKALTIRERLAREHPKVADYQFVLADTHNCLGVLYYSTGRFPQAEDAYRRALAVHTRLAKTFPAITNYQIALGGDSCNLGHLVRDQGKPEDALGWYEKAISTLEAVVQKEPLHVQAKQFLANSHRGRVDALARLGRYAEAAKDWDRLLALDPGELRPWYRWQRALALARSGEHAAATAEADALAREKNARADAPYLGACVYALSSSAVRTREQGSLSPADREHLAEKYAAHAVKLLSKGVAAGLFENPANRELLRHDNNLDALHPRPDFQKLLAELEKQQGATEGHSGVEHGQLPRGTAGVRVTGGRVSGSRL
jgi:serine/threonine protein kinase/tetratricopeptide (TPR) repeat protein